MASTDPVRRAVQEQRDRTAHYRDIAHRDVERLSLLLHEAIEAAGQHARELATLDAFLDQHPAEELCAMAPYAPELLAGRLTVTEGMLTGTTLTTNGPREAFAPLGR